MKNAGCEHKKTKGGHEHWTKTGLNRPITFQTHIEPVPEFIMKQILKHLNLSIDNFWEIFEDKKTDDKDKQEQNTEKL